MKLKPLLFILATLFMAANAWGAHYEQARQAYYELESGEGQRSADRWRDVAGIFAEVERSAPKSRRAADALYMAGKCREFALRISNDESDAQTALAHYKRLYTGYAGSTLADDALFRSARLFENGADKGSAKALYEKITTTYRSGDMVGLARKRLSALGKGVGVVGLRHWSGDKYTRVVVDLTGLSPYRAKALAADEAAGKPPRVFIDISDARLGSAAAEQLEVLDGLVSRIRVAQFDPTTVRVVLDMKSPSTHRVFPLLSPDRLVIDVFRDEPLLVVSDPVAAIIEGLRAPQKTVLTTAPPKKSLRKKPRKKQVVSARARPLRIVIDPGHGGKDPGAVGYKRLKEKDVTLGISLALARKLKKALNCEVKLTRDRDVWLSLSRRTAIANRFGADLFISVHANASRSKRARGIETYYLDRSSDRSARRVAAVENKITLDGVRETEQILADVLLNMKLPESKRLASNIQRSMLSSVSKKYGRVRDLGIKRAPFYVLTGAAMPAVLLETGFVSNKEDARRLKSREYQGLLADAVVSGILKHSRGL